MYVNELSPFVIRFADGFGIQWYGLSLMVSFLLAFLLIRWMTLRQRSEMKLKMTMDFVTLSALGTIIGGRFGYCLFYSPDLFFKFKAEFPFWGVFALGEGGLSAHGAMLGLFIVATIFAIRTGIGRLYLYDLLAFASPLGIFIGRVANFINGEFVGRPVSPDFQYAVKFPTDIYKWPIFEVEKLSQLNLVVTKIPGLSLQDWQQWVQEMGTNEQAKQSVIETVQKIVAQYQDGNLEVRQALIPMLESRHPFQLYAALGEGLFLFLFLFLFWFRPKKSGVVAATFLVLYSSVRIFAENYRMPDPNLGYQWLDLTRGQWLSIGTLLIGAILLFMWGRRETLRVAGWGRGQNVKIHRR